MAAVLGTNTASIWASRHLQSAQSNMSASVERLSSGLRINRAKDDAAGLAIATSLTQQINGANQGIRNLNDGISIVQTADGAIAAATEMAQRILTLATQGASGTLSSNQYTAISDEMVALLASIDSIETRTMFSGTAILAATADITIAASNVTGDNISIDEDDALGAIGSTSITGALLNTALTTGISNVATSAAAITLAENYLEALDLQRANLGSLQNQMEYAVSNVTDLSANLQAARSRVMDTDYANETASLTKGQILQQAATAMLAQANQMPNVILSLLK